MKFEKLAGFVLAIAFLILSLLGCEEHATYSNDRIV